MSTEYSPDSVEAFLAREQQELAGIDDEFGALTTNESTPTMNGSNGFKPPPPTVTEMDFESEIEKPFTNGISKTTANGGGDREFVNGNSVHHQDEEMISGDAPPPNTLSALPLHQQAAMRHMASPTPPPMRDEPAKIKKWREDQKERLEKKDLHEESEKKKLREQAKRDLDEWYRNRQEKLDKAMKRNRTQEQEFATDRDSTPAGQEWERVAKLIEFNPKSARASKDLSRMRTILLQMKNQPAK